MTQGRGEIPPPQGFAGFCTGWEDCMVYTNLAPVKLKLIT